MNTPHENIRPWPIGVRRIAAVIGAKEALRLVEVFGGTEDHHIPKNASPDHPFARVIEYKDLQKLCNALGPCRLEIPRGIHLKPKKLQILEAGGSSREVARKLGVSQRYVRKVRQEFSIARGDIR